ncbi:MAG: hypothetical protein A2298_03910, partial [Gammaproteobacteria bacterium RIFOXYB2_FULL_38_6]
MLKSIALFILFSLCLLFNIAYADAQKNSIGHFSQLTQFTKQLGDPHKTLVVLDSDDTIIKMPCSDPLNPKQCQYLGGPAWFDWQSSLPANSSEKIASSFNELLLDENIMMAVSNMVYTESSVPKTLMALKKQGAIFLVETARNSNYSNNTNRQFAALKVNKNFSLSQFFAENSLIGLNNLPSLPSPYAPCGDKNARPVRYESGILYLAGQDKGKMLHCFLKTVHANQIQNIIFLDDEQKNADSVY